MQWHEVRKQPRDNPSLALQGADQVADPEGVGMIEQRFETLI